MGQSKDLGLVLLSGGLDSAVVATWALRRGVELSALTFHYGQKHSKEMEAAIRLAHALDLRHQVVDITFFKQLSWYSALTSPEQFPTPKDRPQQELSQDIPITYVPLRNTLFLTLAAAMLESEVLDLIERKNHPPAAVRACIFLGPNAMGRLQRLP